MNCANCQNLQRKRKALLQVLQENRELKKIINSLHKENEILKAQQNDSKQT